MRKDTLKRACTWVIGDDTGLSSKQLWAVMMGVEPSRSYCPCDPDDLGRCLRLLDAVPEWKPRIREMAGQSADWDALTARWDELEASFLAEIGSLRPGWGARAPRTYALMKRITEPTPTTEDKGREDRA